MGKKPPKDFEEIFMNNDANTGAGKILWQLFEDKKLQLLTALVFFFIKHTPIWIIPLITENVVNAAKSPGPNTIRIMLWNFGAAIVVLSQNIPMHALYVKYISIIIRDVESKLRRSLVRKLQQLSITFHKDFKSGRIQSKILRDVESIENVLRIILSSLMPAVISSAVSMSITFSKSWMVAVFFVITIPLSVMIFNMFKKNIRKTTREYRQEVEAMSANVSEMVEMIPVTKAHGLGRVEIKRINKQLENVKEKGMATDMIHAYFGSSAWVVFNIAKAVCLLFTGVLAYQGRISIGEIILYQTYFSQILGDVTVITNMYPNIAKGFESIVSVSEILASTDVEHNGGKKRIKELSGSYEFKNVSFAYADEPDNAVLKNFNLNVKKGECVAFVGESGSGKSTILNLLIGFNFPDSGEITVDGNNIKGINLITYRNHIAVVPQTNVLFSGSIRENITYGLTSITDEEVQQVIDMANLRGLIDRLPKGVDTLIGEHGGKLSGGQRQRIAIARAMIRNPDVIILDEATSALDSISEFEVQKAMDKLIKGKTTFIVAHRLSTIRNADKIVVMKNGMCIEVGSYKELIDRQGEFFRLEKLQVR